MKAPAPTSGNDLAEVLHRVNAFGSAIANREHATDKETAERIVDVRFAAIEAYLTRLLKPTSGNDEVEAMAEELRSIAYNDYMIDTNMLPSGLELIGAAALLRKQAAQIDFAERLNKQHADSILALNDQISELQADVERYRFKWAKEGK